MTNSHNTALKKHLTVLHSMSKTVNGETVRNLQITDFSNTLLANFCCFTKFRKHLIDCIEVTQKTVQNWIFEADRLLKKIR